MELENFTFPALNSARSTSDQQDQIEGDSQQADLSQYNSSNNSFSQASSSCNSFSSPYANNYQQQQQYHYQMRVQQQQNYYNHQQQQLQYQQQQQYYQYHFNQGMLQYHHVPMQPQIPIYPIQQQQQPYYQQHYYPQQQYPQQYNPQAYLHPQSYEQHHFLTPAVQRSSSNLSVSSCSSYSSKQQTPEQSGKNAKMEAMRKRLSCVDTGKGGLILKQFGKRNSSGNNIPTFNSNFQLQY